jgi:uncharacterized protein (DUF736 family)
MSFDNTYRGVLFKNQEMSRDNDADYRGNINVAGAEFWLNAWIKTSKAGEKYMSLSVKPKTAAKARPIPGRTDDDEIPF